MQFDSFTFVVFFAIVFGLTVALRRQVVPRNLILLAASYYFYGCWDPRFLVLIFLSTAVDYAVALGVAGVKIEWIKRIGISAFLVVSAILLIAVDWQAVRDGTFEWTARNLLWPESATGDGADQPRAGTREAMIACYVVALTWPLVIELYFALFSEGARRRAFFLSSLVANLGLLAFFKYFGFFVQSAAALLTRLGFDAHPEVLEIILPVGISFYTFQTLSYTIDVYKGEIPVSRNLLNFALFVSYFPQLVAGPIERAKHLLPQMERRWAITRWHVYSGFYLMCWGMFKKIVLADNAALICNSVFNAFRGANPPEDAGLTAWFGVYAFAIQIYCDFSAYSDIARGSARMMGVDIMLNFNLPYFAVNPSDFWRRWHISLSTWLRDYLYIPLGGNRKPTRWGFLHLLAPLVLVSWLAGWNWVLPDAVESKVFFLSDGTPLVIDISIVIGAAMTLVYLAYLVLHRGTYNNLVLTMVLGGLWHGAAWTFVLWGVFHGGLLCVHRALQEPLKRLYDFRSKWARDLWRVVMIVFFFHITCLGWLIFRAENTAQLWTMAKQMFTNFGTRTALLGDNGNVTLAAIMIFLFSVQTIQYRSNDLMVFFKLPTPLRAVWYTILALGLVIFGEFGEIPFIYFQF